MVIKRVFSVLLVCALLLCCGCGVKPSAPDTTASETTEAPEVSEADTTTDVPATSEEATSEEAQEKPNEAEVYTAYLLGGGYDAIMPDRDDPESDVEVESCLVDVDGDGTKELLIRLMDREMGGPAGAYTESALLGIRGGETEILAKATSYGGTGGGCFLHLDYDTVEKQHVLVYESYFRDGIFATGWTQYYLDTHTENGGKQGLGLNEEGGFKFGVSHTLSERVYSRQYYEEEAEKITKETDLYVIDDEMNSVTAYLLDDKYISEAEWNAFNDRFTEPTDPAYHLQSVTWDAPVAP